MEVRPLLDPARSEVTPTLRVVTSQPEGSTHIDRAGFTRSGRNACLGPAASLQLAAFLGQGLMARVFNVVDDEAHEELIGCAVLRRDDRGYSLGCMDVVPSGR